MLVESGSGFSLLCNGESETSLRCEGEGEGYEECDGVLSEMDKEDSIKTSASAKRRSAMPTFRRDWT